MSIIIEEKLIEFLKERRVAKPKEIEDAFDLPFSTARRYLMKLEDRNIIKRTFGEIIYIDKHATKADATANENIHINARIKKAIAEKAATYLKDQTAIFLDSGSSCYYLLDFLPKDIVIYTNSILNANYAVSRGFININIIGGTIKPDTMSAVDIDLDFIKKINFPIAFMGTNGISKSGKLTTQEKREGIVKKLIAEKSGMVVVLADQTKFGEISLYDFAPKDKKITVVSDIEDFEFDNQDFELDKISIN